MEIPLAELKQRLESYLSSRLEAAALVTEIRSLSGGACQDNYLVDLEIKGGNHAGRHELVMRTDKGGSLYASLNRVQEFGAAALAHRAGVTTPEPMWLESRTEVLGHPFYFMRRIRGRADGRFIVKDRSIAKVRGDLASRLAHDLVRIHSVTRESCKDSDLRAALERYGSPTGKGLALAAVTDLRREVDAIQQPRPALELLLNWFEKNAPETDELVLVHGDFRTGNFLVSPEGLEGIVDWEFAHWGDRHEDISWLCMRDWRFGKVAREVGGFADRSEFYAAYEKASGIRVDPEKVRFWEAMGNARWAVGCAQQANRHLSGKDKGIELASIGRRMGEMEFEALRLIENAKPT